MTLNSAISEYLLYLDAVRGLSANSVLGYKKDLDYLMLFVGKDIDIKDVTKENLLFCIGELSKKKMAATSINRFIAAVRTFFAPTFSFSLKISASLITLSALLLALNSTGKVIS